MSWYHSATLALVRPQLAVSSWSSELDAWAKANNIEIPAAYLEWACLDGGLLAKYSNCDAFFLDRPELVTTPEGKRGLLFHRENQGNFEMMCLLDYGDDPPVLFSWVGEPWVTHAERFSDFVYAQIFDWQYRLEFNPRDGAAYIAYSGDIALATDRCVDVLRGRFEEGPATRKVLTWGFPSTLTVTEYRFLRSLRERAVVGIASDGKNHITAMAPSRDLTGKVEAALLELLADDVIAQPIYSPLEQIGWRLDAGWLTQVRFSCIKRPTERALERLVACHQAEPLAQRAKRISREGNRWDLGGSGWGVWMRLRQSGERHGWWFIEEITEA